MQSESHRGPLASSPASSISISRRSLDVTRGPRGALAHIGPNWFACVMGTGIVANAAALLPVHSSALNGLALAFWVLAAGMLVFLVLVTTAHWVLHTDNARGHHLDARMAPFYGAPPMAMLTVGAGALLIGKQVIGSPAAIRIDELLWVLGTIGGLACAVAIPYLMFTHHELHAQDTVGSWLMPIVPPMVSAATGAALIAHLPAGSDRITLLLLCYAMFGLSLFMAMIVIVLIWGRLAYHGLPSAQAVPTLWIVLGPLGQSITAAALLGNAASRFSPPAYASALHAVGIVYGVPTWGFAIAWMSIAAAITIRTARRHLPFSLAWWSFTFPVGTVVTGTAELALHTHAPLFTDIALALYALLVATWLTAASGTARGTFTGRLLRPQPSS